MTWRMGEEQEWMSDRSSHIDLNSQTLLILLMQAASIGTDSE